MLLSGIITACFAPVAQVFGFIIWDQHWRGSSYALNLFKCTFASLLFLIISLSIRNIHIDYMSSNMLILSSFLGIMIGDYAKIAALQIIGPRQVITFDALKPFFAAILGYFILNESFTYMVIIGLLTSSAGIGIVSYETLSTKKTSSLSSNDVKRSSHKHHHNTDEPIEIIFNNIESKADHSFEDSDDEIDDIAHHNRKKIIIQPINISQKIADNASKHHVMIGYFLAFCNVLFDSYGFVLTKQYGSSLNTWEINMIRFGFASAIMIGISCIMIISSYIMKQTSLLSSSSRDHHHRKGGIQFSKLSDDSNHPHDNNVIINPTLSGADDIVDFSDTSSSPSSSKPSSSSKSSSSSLWYMMPTDTMTQDDWMKIIIGVIFVTFISTALTNYAVFQLSLGLCMTLTSLGPIISIPFVYVMKKEKSNINAIGGAMLTIFGIIILTFGNDIHFTYHDTTTSSSSSSYQDHEILSLPGWNEASLPSKQYSGYINMSMNNMMMHTHYWFIESEDDPDDDPLILWFNGGPGASSIYGNLVEIGPFRLSDLSYMNTSSYDEHHIPQLIYNPYGWQKMANLLFISMPPPVGYSYCTPAGPDQVGDACGSWNDTSAADITYHAITSWLSLHHPYRHHDIYIVGESYAGVYIPMIIQRIISHNHTFSINLQGFAIGDACTPPAICPITPSSARIPYKLQFLYGKSSYSIKLHEQVMNTCDDQFDSNIISPTCQVLLDQVDKEVGGYYEYSYYDDCWYENDFSSSSSSSSVSSYRQLSSYEPTLPTYTYHTGVDGYVCGSDRAMFEWLSHPQVKQALHVPDTASFYQVDNADGYPYQSTESDIISYYHNFIHDHDHKMRILIYNGDTDPGINAYRSQAWVRDLGLNETQSWRPWTMDGCQRMGGYVTRYMNNIDHLTIKGSGHMVPLYKAEMAYEFISRFIHDEDYLTYDIECSGKPASTISSSSSKHQQHHIQTMMIQEEMIRKQREIKLMEALHKLSSKQ